MYEILPCKGVSLFWRDCIRQVMCYMNRILLSLFPISVIILIRANDFLPTTPSDYHYQLEHKYLVKHIVNARREGGTYHESWIGTDKAGNAVRPGVYLLELDFRRSSIKRIMLFTG